MVVLLSVVAIASGCAQEGSRRTNLTPQERPADSTASLVRLDAAVAEVNRTRTDLLRAPAAVTAAATALDAADEAAASGARSSARSARATVREAIPPAETALAATAQRAADYRSALQALQQAGAQVPASEDALAAVATAGEVEAAALGSFGHSARKLWPAYTALDKAQALWLERASAGWYRSDDEAADAYAVLVRPQRADLAAARTALREADAAWRPATERQRQALAAADSALDSLRTAGREPAG